MNVECVKRSRFFRNAQRSQKALLIPSLSFLRSHPTHPINIANLHLHANLIREVDQIRHKEFPVHEVVPSRPRSSESSLFFGLLLGSGSASHFQPTCLSHNSY